MISKLLDLPRIAMGYIHTEINLGTPISEIYAELTPTGYPPNLSEQEIDLLISEGVYATREQMASSVWVAFKATEKYAGHSTETRVCGLDEGGNKRRIGR